MSGINLSMVSLQIGRIKFLSQLIVRQAFAYSVTASIAILISGCVPKYEPKLSAQTAKIEERFNVDYTLGANTLVLKTSCSDWRSPIYKNDGSKKFFIVPANRPLTLLPGFQISGKPRVF